MLEQNDVQGVLYIDLKTLSLPNLPFGFIEPYIKVTLPGGEQIKTGILENNVAIKINQIIENCIFLNSKVKLGPEKFSSN